MIFAAKLNGLRQSEALEFLLKQSPVGRSGRNSWRTPFYPAIAPSHNPTPRRLFQQPRQSSENAVSECPIANIELPNNGCHREPGPNISLCVLDIATMPQYRILCVQIK
jgi:hypothetical protein